MQSGKGEFMAKSKNEDNDFMYTQFIKLGDMMGDGLHHEPDGYWITKEYNRLAKILIPEYAEIKKQERRAKADDIDKQMKYMLKSFKCKCGGEVKQRRYGVKTAYCINCGSKYTAKTKKK